MDPEVALERISYLLDRAGESPRRALAYRRAADTVRDLDPAELRQRHTANTLTSLPGIGDSTARAIGEALDGHVPARLAELEASTEVQPVEGVSLRAALRGDCHTHSTWSDGGASIMDMATAARDLGHEYLVVTDHSPRLTVAHGLSAERLREQRSEIEELNLRLAPFRLLTGIEVDILEDGSLDHPDAVLAGLDVVVASVHSKLGQDPQHMTARMIRAAANPHVDILGHCTGRLLRADVRERARRGETVPEPDRAQGTRTAGARARSRFDSEAVFTACAAHSTAVEINSRPERQDPPDDLLPLAVELGCTFAISTDSHAPGQLEWLAFGCDKAARAGIDPDRILNTRGPDELLDLLAS